MTVPHIPRGYHSITPYLAVAGASRLIDFLQQAFDAIVETRTDRPDGSIAHAAVRISDSVVEVCDAQGAWLPMPAAIHVYVPDVDLTFRHAIAAGGVSLYEPVDMFYGERSGGVKDPVGNHWYIATHTEDVSEDEMQRRAAQAFGEKPPTQ
ncbi:MAG TPA: VOC family protein [Pirellulales bacterium]